MRILGHYRGVMFSIPRNDDGVWHYTIHPERDRRSRAPDAVHHSAPEGLPSRADAIAAAKQAIDRWLEPAAAQDS